jgi:primosomal protein N' (replication factor Y) (superfamily II helicase)
LARLEIRTVKPDEAETTAAKLADQLKRIITESRQPAEIIGPVPCFFGRVDGKYRWQIIVRGGQPANLLRGMNLTGWRVEIDPLSLL